MSWEARRGMRRSGLAWESWEYGLSAPLICLGLAGGRRDQSLSVSNQVSDPERFTRQPVRRRACYHPLFIQRIGRLRQQPLGVAQDTTLYCKGNPASIISEKAFFRKGRTHINEPIKPHTPVQNGKRMEPEPPAQEGVHTLRTAR